MDQTAGTAWCPLGLLLSVTNTIVRAAFQEILRRQDQDLQNSTDHFDPISDPAIVVRFFRDDWDGKEIVSKRW